MGSVPYEGQTAPGRDKAVKVRQYPQPDGSCGSAGGVAPRYGNEQKSHARAVHDGQRQKAQPAADAMRVSGRDC